VDKILKQVHIILEECNYNGFLASRSPNGPYINGRIVNIFRPEENITNFYVGTKSDTRKISDINYNPHCSFLFFSPSSISQVIIKGGIFTQNDEKLRAQYWKTEWEPFYPDRVNDYVLLKVAVKEIEIMSIKYEIAHEPLSWRPVVLIPDSTNYWQIDRIKGYNIKSN